MAICRKALIPRQEGRILLPSELDVETKNLESVKRTEKKNERDEKWRHKRRLVQQMDRQETKNH